MPESLPPLRHNGAKSLFAIQDLTLTPSGGAAARPRGVTEEAIFSSHFLPKTDKHFVGGTRRAKPD